MPVPASSPLTHPHPSTIIQSTPQAIDRPLFKDFWERFLSSLQQLRLKVINPPHIIIIIIITIIITITIPSLTS